MSVEFKPLRWGDGKKRKPLRTLPELAEEFGVNMHKLQAAMQHHGGPKPAVKHGNNSVRSAITYYDHDAVRKWWKEFKEKQA